MLTIIFTLNYYNIHLDSNFTIINIYNIFTNIIVIDKINVLNYIF